MEALDPLAQVFVVIPALNEAVALRQLLPDLDSALRALKRPFTICLIDDGSQDDTSTVLAQWKSTTFLQALRHPVNQGYGASLRSGVDWVLQNARPRDVLLTLDSDNTHSPEYFARLLEVLETHDVATASYTLPGGGSRGVPVFRQLMSRIVNQFLAWRFPYAGVQTYTNGFRAYRLRAIYAARERFGHVLIQENDFAGGTQLFLKVLASGARAGEVPFELRYDRRGVSKIRLFRTIRGYLKLLQ